jgi:hypothetical protein
MCMEVYKVTVITVSYTHTSKKTTLLYYSTFGSMKADI